MKGRYYLVLAMLALLVLGVVAVGRWLRPYDLDTERAAARAAGIPLTPAEYPQPAPPPNQDAMPIYNRLTVLLKAKPLSFGRVELSGTRYGALPPTVKTSNLRAFIDGRPDVARLMHAAAAKPHAYFRLDWSPAQLYPHLARMREAAKWIRWESELLIREGRYREAVQNEAASFRFANHAAEEPTIIAHLVSLAIEAIAMQGFKDILHEAGDKPGVAAAVQSEIAAYKSNRDLGRALKGETLMGMTMIRNRGEAGQPERAGGSAQGASANPLLSKWFLEPSEAVHIHWMRRLVEASQAPVERRQGEMSAVQQEFEYAMGKGSRFHLTSPSFSLTALLEPLYPKSVGRDMQSNAKRDVLLAAASVLAYRQRWGKYPAALSDAAPAGLARPKQLNPVAYAPSNSGFSLMKPTRINGLDAQGADRLDADTSFTYPAPVMPRSAARMPMPLRTSPGGPPMPSGR